MSGLRNIGDSTVEWRSMGLMHMTTVLAVAFFKDGQRIVTASDDKTLQIWNVEERGFKLVGRPFEGHRDRVDSVTVSPDDRRIASGGGDGAIIIWDVDSKQMVFKLKRTRWVRSVCFSPDGKRLASGSHDGKIIIWDAEVGAVLSTLQDKLGPVLCVAFSPDGLKLASCGSHGIVRVWRTNNAELLLNIRAHQNFVSTVVWTPDGQQVVSASYDKTIMFWNSSNGTQIGQPFTGHTGEINSLAISSDGSFIATASRDNTLCLWNTKSHQQIGRALEYMTSVYSVAISLSGELLVGGDFDGFLQSWSIKNTPAAAFRTGSSHFAHRSEVKSGQNLNAEALTDAKKVIELNRSSHLGYELQPAALRSSQRYDDPNPRLRQLHQLYISPSKEDAIQRAIHAQLENAPFRLINTSTGCLCNRDAQINAFSESRKYKKLLSPSVMRGPLQTKPIKEAVAKYFSWVMLSHRWERKEPLLHDIQGRDIYDLDPVGTIVKLQEFCKVARKAGYHWAWSDTCCIEQNNNLELQESVNSMFVWYHYSALTIVYLSDVPPLSKSGALANSVWNTRGWTVQEFLAPKIVLFYQANWTLYLDDRSCNHKQSVSIMRELEYSTGINARALVSFHPGTRDAREKLRWASNRETTREEDIAYSLFGIFDVNLPVIYGEKRQKALGRLLQEIIAHSGDITALDWVGRSSNFNSCLPADISSYKAPSCTPPLPEHDMQMLVSALRNQPGAALVEPASRVHTLLQNISAPRFSNARLQLPCITFPLTEVRLRPGQDGARSFTYDVKADGLQDLLVTTRDKLVQFSPARRTRQTFFLIRPWNRYEFEVVNFADEPQNVDNWPDEPGDDELVTEMLRLSVRLRCPFGALLLAQQRGGEYKRIASDKNIIAQVKGDTTSYGYLNDVRTLEIL